MFGKLICALLVPGLFLTSSELFGQSLNSKPIFVPGFTMGTRIAMMPRAGVDLSLLKRTQKGDGFAGYGAIAGISGLDPFEYYVGFAGGGAYMISAWGEITANFVDKNYTGLRALVALGFIVMPYIAVGYDKRLEGRMYAETGLTIKVPLGI